jgi:hypothetical protein
MRHVRQHIVEQRLITRLTQQSCLDVVLGPLRPVRAQQQIDVEPIASIGRHAPGRGVGLTHETLFLEPGEDAPDRRG